MSDRERIIRRIAQLREKTVARGCTEAEAMAAAEMAAKLMLEYDLADGDVEVAQEDAPTRHGGGSAVRAGLWSAVAVATNTAMILRTSMGVPVVTYVGAEPGPPIAVYLHRVTDRAIDRELTLFRATPWYRKRRTLKAKKQATADFTAGMVSKMRARLYDLFAETMSDSKVDAAIEERSRRWPDSQTMKPAEASGRYYDAALAGRAAGDRVTLTHGIAGGIAGQPLRIGGAR